MTVRYWAAARETAGVSSDSCEAATVAEALAGVVALRGERLGRLLSYCSFLVDGAPVGERDPATVPLRPGAVLEVLPPFAGG